MGKKDKKRKEKNRIPIRSKDNYLNARTKYRLTILSGSISGFSVFLGMPLDLRITPKLIRATGLGGGERGGKRRREEETREERREKRGDER